MSYEDYINSIGSSFGSSTLWSILFLYIRCMAMKNIGFVNVSSPWLLLRSQTLAQVYLSSLVWIMTCCISESERVSELFLSNILNIFM